MGWSIESGVLDLGNIEAVSHFRGCIPRPMAKVAFFPSDAKDQKQVSFANLCQDSLQLEIKHSQNGGVRF